MNWILNQEIKILLMPLLQKIAEKFASWSEFPLQVAIDVKMPTPIKGGRDMQGCGVVRFMQGAWGEAPCCGNPEIIVFVGQHLWKDDVLVCRISHPLMRFHREVEEFVKENSQEILSQFNKKWEFIP